MVALAEIYISVNVKASGPVPGLYAMTAMGAAVVGGVTTRGELVTFPQAHEQLFYRELKPLSGQTFEPKALNVGELKGFFPDEHATPAQEAAARWSYLKASGDFPKNAMLDLSDFVTDAEARFHAPAVFLSYPAGFAWMFVQYYFHSQKIKPPFGFSRMLDIKTAYSVATQRALTSSVRERMAESIEEKVMLAEDSHSHRADEDAYRQGLMGLATLALVYGPAKPWGK